MVNTIVGILLGAFISWAAYAYKTRDEKRQVLNKALFSILRVWKSLIFSSLIGSVDFEKITSDVIAEKFPDEADRVNEELLSMKEKAFRDEIFSHYADNDGFTIETYKKALADIALFDPLLAFQISSIPNLIKVLNSYDEYFDEHKSNEEIEEGTLKFIGLLEGLANTEFMSSFTSSIQTLANKSLSRTERKSVVAMLDRVHGEKMKVEIEQELREMIEKLLDQYIEDRNSGGIIPELSGS